ncbi:MAG: hypothetical protein ABI222_11205 [Opitutaceae bacterium]
MKTLVLACLGLVLAGCQSAPPRPVRTERARFLLESPEAGAELITLPQSGVQISVQPKPVFTEFDIVNVEIAQVDMGMCLMFQLTPTASKDLAELTAANRGRRLVLTINGVPMGARRIVEPLDLGALLIFVEAPDSVVPALVENLQETSAALQADNAQR